MECDENGITLKHPSYTVNFDKLGVTVKPTSGGPIWSWSNEYTKSVSPIYRDDTVFYEHNTWAERYVIKEKNIEQQFVLYEPPVSQSGVVRFTGKISSEGEFKSLKSGWSWQNEKGSVTLGNVFVFDNKHRQIPAVMHVTHSESVIEIVASDLVDAVYPVTVDPEIGANDFRVSFTGPDGDLGFGANNATVAHCVTDDPATYPGGIYLVVWAASNSSKEEVYAQRVNGATGALIGSEIRVSFMGVPSTDVNYGGSSPDVAASSTEFFVVWQGDDNSGSLVNDEYEIYGQRIIATSGSLVGTRIRISNTNTDGLAAFDAANPAVAYNATSNRYLVTWYSDHVSDNQFEIYSQGLEANGTLVGSNVRISTMGPDPNTLYDAFNPDVAWNSTSNQYMIAWHGDIDAIGDGQNEVFIRRVDGSVANHGNTIGTMVLISDMGPTGSTLYTATDVAIAYNVTNNNYLVVWRGDDDTAPLVNDEFEIFGQFVSNTGTVSSIHNFFRISFMGTDGFQNFGASAPAIAYDPNLSQFLVTWHGDHNVGGLVDNEFEIFGQLIRNDGVIVGSNFRLSDAGGTGNTSFNATLPAVCYNGSYREFLVLWQGDDNYTTTIDNEIEIWGQRFAETSIDPTSQPTTPVFTSITSSSLNVSFTAATGSPDGYLVLRKAGSSPTDVPTDQQVYTVGSFIGTSTVVHVGSATSFTQSGLSPNTQYFYDFFSYNGVNSATNYRTVSPLEGNATTLFSEPTTQGTLSVTSFGTSSVTINLSAGNGTNRLLVAKAGSAVDVFPVDGVSYTPNNNITLAPNLGSSNFVVGSGTGSVTVSGLSLATVYHFRVFEFNGTGTLTNYNTNSVAGSIGSQTTLSAEPTAQPTAINFTSITNASFTVGYTTATGSPSGYIAIRKAGSAPAQPADLPVDGTTYAVNDPIGGSAVAYVGSSLSFAQSSLTPATQYFYLILSYNGSGGNINYFTTTPLAGNQFTLANEPTTQATNISFSSLAPNSLTINWTNGNGAERLVMARQGATVSVNPADGTGYTGNADFSLATDVGSGNKVVYRGNGNSVTVTNLAASTVYHFRVYELNGSSASANYLTSTATGNPGSRTTLANEPLTQASGINFSSITPNSMSVNFTNGNGTSRLLVARAGSAVNADPADGSSYTANTAFGSGSEIGTGNFVVGAGSGPITITGLSSGNTYHFRVYEFNGTSAAENYNVTTATNNPSNATTLIGEPTIQATNITFTAFTDNSLSINWTNGNGAERLVLARQGSAVNVDPADGASYTGNANFSTATDIGSGNKVVFRGAGNSVAVTNLAANTVYHFRVYELNGSGVSTNYLLSTATGNPASRTTLATEPTAQPTAALFTLQTTTSLRLSYTAATGSPTGYLIIRKAGSASSGIPVDGTFYSVGNSLDGTIVAIGNFTQFDDTGLSAGTGYHYTVFSYNGAGQAVNYLTSSPLTGFTITLPVAPTASAASGVGQFQFTANWNSVTGAANYLLDVSLDNFSSFVSGYNSKTVTGTSDAVTGLTAGTTYQYRVRAANASGQSVNSNTISQITVPPTPVGVNITGAEQTQFAVAWTSSLGAVDYLLDISMDNFSTFVTGYNGKVITGTSENVTTGLAAGNTYQVRVRSRNAGGTSPNSSTATQLLKPATPLALDANPIGINSFTAKWDPANGAASYILDVSTQNDFSTHLTGYPNNEGNTLEKLITGLTANSSYYYRVKAVNATGESPYSNIKPVQTQPDPGPQNMVIGIPTYTDLVTGQTQVPISVTVTGGTGSKTVEVYHRKITSTGASAPLSMSNTSGNIWEADLPASAFDELGAEFFIRASDATAVPPVENSAIRYVYKSFTDQTAQAITSIVRHGGTQKSYQIISIPLALTKNSIADIFEPVPELGAYDKTKWRLVRFQNNKNTDYKEGINAIDRGKSYWFNSVSEVTVKTGAGTTPNNNQATPFTMPLAQGWNQIATPYPFAIDWDDVLAANGNPAVGSYKVFNSNQLSFDVVNSMKPFEGGFVFADNAVPSLSFPVTLKNTAGGRIKHDEELSKDIDSEKWLLPLKLVQDDAVNELGGIGMHPQASLSKDRFDDVTVPRFVQYLETNFYHPEFFWPKFSRDVVPITEEYAWSLTIESNGSGPIELRWDAGAIAHAQSALFLVDEEDARVFDMRTESSIAFTNTDRKELKLVYTHRGEYIPGRTRLGTPWPNPAGREVNIPFILAESNGPYQVEMDVFDLKGVKVATLSLAQLQAGAHVSVWDTRDGTGSEMPNAIYIIKLKVNGRYLPEFSRVVVNRKQ
ncbi:MAG: fibronectin type III domain-containing protein [Flammeovirgaceae bacterium]|nr:MAG: fibronectin type III domain-containing protein [Flammeovirgaceae bacterium]